MPRKIRVDWFKVGTKYMLTNEFTKAEKGALVEILALVAFLERMPTDREINEKLSKKMSQTLAEKLSRVYSSTLREVVERCLNDVRTVKDNRSRVKDRVAKLRLRETECNALRNNVSSPLRNDVEENKIVENIHKKKAAPQKKERAAFLEKMAETQNPENGEPPRDLDLSGKNIEQILDRVVGLRVDSGIKAKKPIGSVPGLRATLKAAFDTDNRERVKWEGEIQKAHHAELRDTAIDIKNKEQEDLMGEEIAEGERDDDFISEEYRRVSSEINRLHAEKQLEILEGAKAQMYKQNPGLKNVCGPNSFMFKRAMREHTILAYHEHAGTLETVTHQENITLKDCNGDSTEVLNA